MMLAQNDFYRIFEMQVSLNVSLSRSEENRKNAILQQHFLDPSKTRGTPKPCPSKSDRDLCGKLKYNLKVLSI